VSFQQFKTQLLEKGLVDHIEVTNTKTARVFVRASAAASAGNAKRYGLWARCVCEADRARWRRCGRDQGVKRIVMRPKEREHRFQSSRKP
jgi:hypothetical protein